VPEGLSGLFQTLRIPLRTIQIRLCLREREEVNLLNLRPGLLAYVFIKPDRTGIGDRKLQLIFSNLSADVLGKALKDLGAG
jgi:hypothetical protein